jgi:anti-sigma B factor antagonist
MTGYTIEHEAGHCRVILEGDLTASLVPELQGALKAQLEQPTKEVVFDLAATGMLDSSGIGLLIATYNSLSRQQGRVSVIHVSPDILQLLQSMRLVNRLNASGRAAQEVTHG